MTCGTGFWLFQLSCASGLKHLQAKREASNQNVQVKPRKMLNISTENSTISFGYDKRDGKTKTKEEELVFVTEL